MVLVLVVIVFAIPLSGDFLVVFQLVLAKPFYLLLRYACTHATAASVSQPRCMPKRLLKI